MITSLYHNKIETYPFIHTAVDGFLRDPDAIAKEFPSYYDHDVWLKYNSAFQIKKTCNNWFHFKPATYKLFTYLMSEPFINGLRDLFQVHLYPDYGLHGGGLHCHGNSGVLHPHLDYSVHPRLGLERRLNIILYVEPEMKEDYGGHLGLWEGDAQDQGKLVKEIAPLYNRAVIFDTTQNSWHGMSRALSMPDGVFRKSLAVYYLCQPHPTTPARDRATFRSPT